MLPKPQPRSTPSGEPRTAFRTPAASRSREAALSAGILLLLAGWGLWCTLHSLLITTAATRYFETLLGPCFRYYRAAYVLFSLGSLLPLILVSNRMDQGVVLAWEGGARLVPALGNTAALSLFLAGAKHYDALQFLGLRQARTGHSPRTLAAGNRLDTTGILSVIRHPWYTATFLLLWSHDLTRLSILINTLLSVYLIVGTLLEERKLAQEFGTEYLDYQTRVSMFIPFKWLLSRRSQTR